MDYILSQIFTILAYALLGVTYLTKKKNLVLLLNAFSTISFTIAYIFLFAWSGVKMNMISLLRNLIFYMVARFAPRSKKWNIASLATILGLISLDALLCVIIKSGIFMISSAFDIMPYFATAIYSIAIWNGKGIWYKIFGILSSVAWIVYNAFVHSFFGIILEAVMIIFAIIGLIKHEKDSYKNKTTQGEV